MSNTNRSLLLRRAERHVSLMSGVLLMLAFVSALVGAVGCVNWLHGDQLRASSSLALPVFLSGWTWQVRFHLRDEPLIPIFGVAWVVGLVLGGVAYALSMELH